MDDLVEEALTKAALWDEVKDKLKAERLRTCRVASSSACALRDASPCNLTSS